MSQRASDLLAARDAAPGSGYFLWRLAVRAGRWRLFLALGLAVAAALAGAGFTFMLAQTLPVAISVRAFTPYFHHLLMIAAVLLLVRTLAGYASETMARRNAALTRVVLRHELFERLQENGPVIARQQTAGAISSTLMEKVEACDGYIAKYLPQLAVALVVPPFILLVVAYFDITSALILAGCALALLPALAISGLLAGRANQQQFQALSRLSGLFHDRLRHLPTLRAFGAEAAETKKLGLAAQDFRQRTMAVLRLAFLSASLLDVAFMLALAAIALHVFALSTSLAGKLTVILMVTEFFAPLRALAASYHERASALAAVADIRSLLEPQRTPNEGRRPAPSPLRQPSLELRNITYTYPGRTQAALEDFTLRVEGSEFLAVEGASGSGKSTLINLLLGFIEPHKGMLFLAGQPLHLINPPERTSAFAWVGQSSHLFYGTLADNIRLGRPEASETEIMKAAEDAHLGDFIRSLPQGLQTLIGEGGFGLSGGQAQRVALARAFLRDAPVLLLDEPTAGLDHATATLLMLTVRKLAEGRTVLMVSHDPIALKAAERVVRLGATS